MSLSTSFPILGGAINSKPSKSLSTEVLLASINQLIVETKERFGLTNPVLYQYQQLRVACLLQEFVTGSYRASQSIVEALSEIARLTFGVETVSFGDPIGFHGSIPCFSFPADAFSAEYKKALERFGSMISATLTFDPAHQDLLTRFSYIIGTEFQWRHCRAPQSISDVFLGNRSQTFSPFHPVLAYDLDLTVACAGEVAFCWQNQKERPDIVMINNVSGHFRPVLRASELEALTRVTLRLSSETSVLALANDGFRVSGPFARELSGTT